MGIIVTSPLHPVLHLVSSHSGVSIRRLARRERRGNVCHTNREVNFQYPRSTKKGEFHVLNRSMDTFLLTLLFCA